MPRIRSLDPGFFKDEHLAMLPFNIRLFYEGLWCHADRAGRLEDRPLRLKTEIMPYDTFSAEGALTLLSKYKNGINRPFIIRYEIEGERYIQIVSWHKYQKPHHTERPSIIPPPIKEKDKDIYKDKDKCSSPESELNNVSLTDKKTLELRKQHNSFNFNKIWEKYPNRVGKKQAEKHFISSVKTLEDFGNIQKALDNYLKSDRVANGYIQNGSTWFNNWQDWVVYRDPRAFKLTPAQQYTKQGIKNFLEENDVS